MKSICVVEIVDVHREFGPGREISLDATIELPERWESGDVHPHHEILVHAQGLAAVEPSATNLGSIRHCGAVVVDEVEWEHRVVESLLAVGFPGDRGLVDEDIAGLAVESVRGEVEGVIEQGPGNHAAGANQLAVHNGLGFAVIDVGHRGTKPLELPFTHAHHVAAMVLVIVSEFVVDVDRLLHVFRDIHGDGAVFPLVVVLHEGGFFLVCFQRVGRCSVFQDTECVIPKHELDN